LVFAPLSGIKPAAVALIPGGDPARERIVQSLDPVRGLIVPAPEINESIVEVVRLVVKGAVSVSAE